uniref:Uncharacterized protein n=1 Tax=Cherax quadricarinatus TaxID=27406 RepID=G0ZJF2_CHEQU|nr:unknown [Cherax quadricarinatus]
MGGTQIRFKKREDGFISLDQDSFTGIKAPTSIES